MLSVCLSVTFWSLQDVSNKHCLFAISCYHKNLCRHVCINSAGPDKMPQNMPYCRGCTIHP